MSDIIHSAGRSISAPMMFSALPQVLQSTLVENSHIQRFEQNAIIQQRGDPGKGFWLLESGSVSVGQFLEHGEFRAAAVLEAGDSWGELAMFAARPRAVDAIARTRCEVRYIRAERFEAVLAENPATMRRLLGVLSAQLQETLGVLAGIRRGTAGARVAALLATMAGPGAGEARLKLKQHELGELLGLTRATVNGCLRELEDGGLIERGYGFILITDRETLSRSTGG